MNRIREEVIGQAVGVLADTPAGVSPHRIEVAQQDDIPSRVGKVEILQNLLDHEL